MTLTDAYAEYLRTRSRVGLEQLLAAALDDAGLVTEAELWRGWCDRATSVEVAGGPWGGRRAHLGVRPPEAAAIGDIWFDVAEMTPMIHAGRAWLATRPTAVWQVRGFLGAAERIAREVQVAPPYRALDRDRLAGGADGDRVTRISEGEATLYAWWFGKTLPHLFDWQSAEESLPGAAMRELWRGSSREWTSNRLADDEAARVFVTPSTIQWDPGEVLDDELARPEKHRSMIRGELTRDPEIGFRTAVMLQIGLLRRVSAWHAIPEPVQLVSLVDRGALA